MRYLAFIIIPSISFSLIACTQQPSPVSMAKLDCSQINWRHLGEEDAKQGKYQNNLHEAIPTCTSNVFVDRTAYDKGWQKGIRIYCQPENAHSLGVEGKFYNNVCPVELASDFDKAWRKGLHHFCVPNKAYLLGLENKPYPNFCPKNSEAEFFAAYQKGKEHHLKLEEIEMAYKEASNALDSVKSQFHEMQQMLVSKEISYKRSSFSPEKQYEIQKLNITLRKLSNQEKQLIAQSANLKKQYEDLKENYLVSKQ